MWKTIFFLGLGKTFFNKIQKTYTIEKNVLKFDYRKIPYKILSYGNKQIKPTINKVKIQLNRTNDTFY